MLRKLKEAGLIWPTAAALLALAVLLALGSWQMQRKAWKEDLIARILTRTTAQPVDLPAASGLANQGDREYLHVAVAGRLRHEHERYLYAPTPAGLGWHVFTPMQTTSGQLVWINRGWVPDARKDPAGRQLGQLPGTVRITGLIREVPAPGLFTPANDAARNLWYWPDIAAMTADAYRAAPGATRTALPFWIDADALPGSPGGLPKGGVTRLELPNRHLEYALTWYGIAVTLIGVYFAFAANRLGLFSGNR
ncbi:MAG TPA: SURF1 family protein [Hyphomicrobiaceae bacterium]|nr:SURF1 family protein [Hyphomicrobiaceae bacterium]